MILISALSGISKQVTLLETISLRKWCRYDNPNCGACFFFFSSPEECCPTHWSILNAVQNGVLIFSNHLFCIGQLDRSLNRLSFHRGHYRTLPEHLLIISDCAFFFVFLLPSRRRVDFEFSVSTPTFHLSITYGGHGSHPILYQKIHCHEKMRPHRQAPCVNSLRIDIVWILILSLNPKSVSPHVVLLRNSGGSSSLFPQKTDILLIALLTPNVSNVNRVQSPTFFYIN